METTQINETSIREYAKELADEVRTEYGDDYDVHDAIHEVVDGCELVIYYAQARRVVDALDTEQVEAAYEQVRDCGVPDNFATLLTHIAYHALTAMVESALNAEVTA